VVGRAKNVNENQPTAGSAMKSRTELNFINVEVKHRRYEQVKVAAVK